MKSAKFAFFILMVMYSSCDVQPSSTVSDDKKTKLIAQNITDFKAIMQKHLDAVSNRDLASLKSTMHPSGKMQLIVPSTEIIDGVDGFIDYHRAWFQDTNWTFETKILNTEVHEKLGLAVTEIIYREPERDGKPYFNRMIVSYDLEKVDDKWYIIKDHASSVEKSTDKS